MTTALAADLITQNCPREQGGVGDKQRVRRRERWRRGEKVEGPIQREECEMGDSKVSIWEERSRFVESRDRWRGGIRRSSSGRGRRAQTVDFTPRHSDWKWCTCVSHTHTHAVWLKHVGDFEHTHASLQTNASNFTGLAGCLFMFLLLAFSFGFAATWRAPAHKGVWPWWRLEKPCPTHIK